MLLSNVRLSFVSQRFRRIDTGCAAGREPNGQQSYGDQNDWRRGNTAGSHGLTFNSKFAISRVIWPVA